jgi:hypothetical protein
LKSRYLFITGILPDSYSGGGQRSYLFLKALREVGEVDLLVLSNSNFDKISEERIQAIKLEHKVELIGIFYAKFFQFKNYKIPKYFNRLSYSFQLIHHLLSGKKYQKELVIHEEVKRIVENKKYDAIICRYMSSYAKSGAKNFQNCLVDLDDLNITKLKSKEKWNI